MTLDTEHCLALQRGMVAEVRRAMKGLKLEGNPRPFFVSQLMHISSGLTVWGRYGAVFHSQPYVETDLYAEVRVGSYRLDQSIDGGLANDLAERESFHWIEGPEDLSPDALRYCIWKLTQLKYEEALQDYYDKKKLLVEQPPREHEEGFASAEPTVLDCEIEPVRYPRKRWQDLVRETSELFKGHKKLVDPYVRIRGLNKVRIYANSEGSRFLCQEKYFEVAIQAWYHASDGSYLGASRLFYGRKRDELPTRERIEEAIDELARDLADLARAEPLEPYAGPALLSGLASGLIFHEAIGHRLEGERTTARAEGQTFARKLGSRILPAGIDIVDDPSLSSFEGTSLYGHYLVDDEGVPAQPAVLVEDGILKSFLASRATIPGQHGSNGHGRHERHEDPMARMANLIVRTRDGHDSDELMQMLMDEVDERELPYGILVRGVAGGETRTDRYDFQAFKGTPTEVYTVDPASGRETRVRNVSFIGTPLAVIQRILAYGRTYDVDNSYCFAESGSVPVATIAPPLLVGDLELQRTTNQTYRPPILPLPPMRAGRG